MAFLETDDATRDAPFTPRLIDGLFLEALRLAEMARDYFDTGSASERLQLQPLSRVVFSCESLKVTTRVMHVISWLMVQKAHLVGELDSEAARSPERRLGAASDTDVTGDARLEGLPNTAMELIQRSVELYDRVQRLDARLDAAGTLADDPDGPARALQDKLGAAF